MHPIAVRQGITMLVVLVVVHAAVAQTQNTQWTGAGDGISYADPANWSPVLTVPPLNIAPVSFNVNIPYVAAHAAVQYDAALGHGAVNNLTLADNAALRLRDVVHVGVDPNATSLTVLGDVTINGYLDIENADFTATAGAGTLGTQARLRAAGGAQVLIDVPSYASTDLRDSCTLMSSTDEGSLLNLSSLTSISDAFYVNFGSYVHSIEATQNGQIDLSGVTQLTGPAQDEQLHIVVNSGGQIDLSALSTLIGLDSGLVKFSAAGGSSMDLSALTTIDADGQGQTQFSITGPSTLTLPSLEQVRNTVFHVAQGAVASDTGSGPWTYASSGLRDSCTLMSSTGGGSLLDLSSLTSINDAFYVNFGSYIHTIEATDGGQIDLSGVTQLTGPVQDEQLHIVVNSGGQLDLSALAMIAGGDSGRTQFWIAGPSSLALPSLEEAAYTEFHVSGGGNLSDAGSGSWTYSAAGLHGSYTLMSSTGGGSLLDLSSLTSINDAFYVNFGSYIHTIEATDGGQIDLSGVTQLTGPVQDEQLHIVASGSGQIDLSALAAITGFDNGLVHFSAADGSSIDLSSLRAGAMSAGRISLSMADGSSMTLGSLSLSTTVQALSFIGVASSLTVHGSLHLGANAVVSVEQGAGIHVGGHFTFAHTNEQWLALTAATLTLDGDRVQLLEVGGLDVGLATFLLADDNFAIGQLVVDQAPEAVGVQLTNAVNNGNSGGFGGAEEALYLVGIGDQDGLRILDGSVLAIGSYHVYASMAGVLTDISGLFTGVSQRIAFDEGFIQNVLFGDFDGDGSVNTADINPFILALTNPGAFASAYPAVALDLIDPNGDGRIDTADINPFIILLTGADAWAPGQGAVVPEPTALMVLILAASSARRQPRR